MTNESLDHILVLGGGAAGWLSAALLAAEHGVKQGGHCQITLVEAPDIATVGVGEGTWPSMRETLRRIGFPEQLLFTQCDASFKQGSQFLGWRTGDDRYYHPFALPHGYFQQDLGYVARATDYAYAVSPQPSACDRMLAPKQLATPEYAGVLNYGYHFNAGKFADCLREHCTRRLGVQHQLAEVVAVQADEHGHIRALQTREGEQLTADFFIDCSGSRAQLIGEHFHEPWISQRQQLRNDRAIATQLPYAQPDDAIASVTRAWAQPCGWVWDIALSTRAGLGFVYTSEQLSQTEAEEVFSRFLRERAAQAGLDVDRQLTQLSLKHLQFEPGYRRHSWRRNCVAIGMSAGFIEPLEASALALVEQAAAAVRDWLPRHKDGLAASAVRYNQRMQQHWAGIVDFLKLHYVLSERTEPYWQAQRTADSVPESLQHSLQIWRDRQPISRDLAEPQPLFPAASYRYVLQGMQAPCSFSMSPRQDANRPQAEQLLQEVAQQTGRCLNGLPGNRALLNQLRAGGGK